MDLVSYILLITSVIGFLAFIVVLFKMHTSIINKTFFLLFIFSISYYIFLVFLFTSNLIYKYPHFFRTASPFFYLLSISFYFYYNSYLKIFESKKLINIILFFIPIIHIIELLPFYLQNRTFKQNYLLNAAVDKDAVIYTHEGWIPTSWHFILQLCLGIIIFSYVYLDIIKNHSNIDKKKYKLINWFKWASFIQLIGFIFLLFILIIDTEGFIIYTIASIVFGLIQLIIVLNLFLVPELIYGNIDLKLKSKNKPLETSLSKEGVVSYHIKIEEFFNDENNNKLYLKYNFRLNHLAQALKISKNNLSYVINISYNLNFNELVNKKRIRYFKKHFEENNENWKNLKLSGIGQELGFKSRTTFIKAFKKNTGKTPSKYIKHLKQDT